MLYPPPYLPKVAIWVMQLVQLICIGGVIFKTVNMVVPFFLFSPGWPSGIYWAPAGQCCAGITWTWAACQVGPGSPDHLLSTSAGSHSTGCYCWEMGERVWQDGATFSNSQPGPTRAGINIVWSMAWFPCDRCTGEGRGAGGSGAGAAGCYHLQLYVWLSTW